MLGTVVEFDEPRGLGKVTAEGAVYPFHCTAIAGGTRTVEVGAAVAFEVRPGGLGRWEATALTVVHPGDGGISATASA